MGQKKMNVPLLDLKAQYDSIRDEIEPVLKEIIESQYFILGPHVEECEAAVAEYSGCRFGVGVSSGTDALLLALMAEGIGPGDEVITSPFTFFATAGCIHRTGARPVFIDIAPKTFNLDPDLLERAVTGKTKAIMPVHLFGQMAEMDRICDIAGRRGLSVIEDAAQAIGAEYDGRRAGGLGQYGCFSFFPSKNLGCFGDGGMVVTNDAENALRLKRLRNHGMEPKYYHGEVGGNFRLDALQAAVIRIKLSRLEKWTQLRRENAACYGKLFEESGLLANGYVGFPCLPSQGSDVGSKGHRHVYNQFTIRVQDREDLKEYLAERGIGTEIYYPVPLHLQECFRYLRYHESDFPQSEAAAEEVLSLPVYPELRREQIEYVVQSIGAFFS